MKDEASPPDQTTDTLAEKVRQLEGELASLKQALQVMEDRDIRYTYALEATADGLWDWHIPSGRVYFNPSYLRMLGYDENQLPSTLDTLRNHFVHPDDVTNLFTEYQSALDNHRDSVQLQFRLRHRNGEAVWVQAKAKFFEPDHTGRATRCVGMNSDISDFVKTHDELLSAKAQADLANNTKSEFLARISHEIRTPMNAILGMGYLMQDTPLDEQQRSYLNSLNSAADSLLQIINQLLDFSKIETGRVILEHAHFDLEQLFEKISRLFEISALHRSVNIIYDIKPEVPRFLRGDASRLSQILGHLISNAFQYSQTDEVLVRVAKASQTPTHLILSFTVEDKGVGIEPATLAQIKQRLLSDNTLNGTDKAVSGLSICSHLANLMQGDLTLESSPHKGCKVSFQVMLEHSHLGDSTLLRQPRDLHNLRVLIVDDNKIARTIIASTARSLHLQVDEEDSALHAFARLRAADEAGTPYHYVLVDYRMPDMNGLQLSALIKTDTQLQQKPCVFLISAYHRDEIINKDTNAIFVDEFLSKPVSESRLFDAINQTLSQAKVAADAPSTALTDEDTAQLLENARVLIAEDNLVNQHVLRGILNKKHITSLIAANGLEALHLLETSDAPFDAVLMDLEMPEMGGLEATSHIRAGEVKSKFPVMHIPIIAVTAQAMRGDRERCLAVGMDGYLSKPVNPELLYSTLADILRSHHRNHHYLPH